jgi:hypothetical protein
LTRKRCGRDSTFPRNQVPITARSGSRFPASPTGFAPALSDSSRQFLARAPAPPESPAHRHPDGAIRRSNRPWSFPHGLPRREGSRDSSKPKPHLLRRWTDDLAAAFRPLMTDPEFGRTLGAFTLTLIPLLVPPRRRTRRRVRVPCRALRPRGFRANRSRSAQAVFAPFSHASLGRYPRTPAGAAAPIISATTVPTVSNRLK